MGIQKILPETGETLIDLPAQEAGTLRFSCGMGMYRGQIEFVSASTAQSINTINTNPQTNRVPKAGECDPNIMSCAPVSAKPSNGNFGPLAPKDATAQASALASASAGVQTLTVQVSGRGYEPKVSHAKANQPAQLVLKTEGTWG